MTPAAEIADEVIARARPSDRALALALDGAGVGVIVTDRDQRILHANPAFARETGYSPQEVMGRSPRLLHGPGTDPAARRVVREGLARGEAVRHLILNYAKNGRPLWFRMHIAPVFEGGRLAYFVGVQENCTAQVEGEARLERAALTDPLTGLGNRRAFDRALAAERAAQARFSILFLDLDGFKLLNDSLGHPAGDAALRETGEALAAGLRGAGTAYRVGGDEFAAVLPGLDAAGAAVLARLAEVAVSSVRAGGARLGASAGAATFPDDGADLLGLVRAADKRMYARKAARRS